MTFDLSARVDAMVRLDADAPALTVDDRWRPWSYLSDAVDGLDSFLSAHGFGPGVRVGILMRNRPEVVRGLVATIATRRCVVTLSPMIPRAALLLELGHLRLPVVLIGELDWHPEIAEAVARSGGVAVEICDDGPDGSGKFIGRTTFPPTPAQNPCAPGIAVQMLTSGTTGPARRADITYDALAQEFRNNAQPGRRDELAEPRLSSGTAVSWAPMVHIGGLRAVLAAVLAGRRLAMLEKFELDAWQRLLVAHRPRAISLVPTALRMVFDANVPREIFDSVQVVMCGTAPVSPDLVDAFEQRYDVAVLTMYGATEFGGVAGWTYQDWQRYRAAKRGSVGRPNRGVEARVVDPDTGEERGADQDGLLEVRGGQTGSSGWVRTTDRARLDRDGFLWILGRADDVINRGGFKVSLAGVREALLAHPSVRDAVVMGMPDDRLGQVPVAAAEVPSGDVTAAQLVEHLSDRLARYQVPVAVHVLRALPRTPSMKPDGVALRALFADAPEAG